MIAQDTGVGRASTESETDMTLITGNTYPVKTQLKALGAKWNATLGSWELADSLADQAWALVEALPAKPARKPSRPRVWGPCPPGMSVGELGVW